MVPLRSQFRRVPQVSSQNLSFILFIYFFFFLEERQIVYMLKFLRSEGMPKPGNYRNE